MKKDKSIPVRGHGGPYGSKTSGLPHFLDNWLTDGSETILYAHEDPWRYRLSRPKGHIVRLEML
jgi:hypothetical protein